MLPQAFMPLPSGSTLANSAAIGITASNQAVALPNGAQQSSCQVRLYNNSSNAIAITFGQGAANAVAVFPTGGTPANGIVMAPGAIEVFSVPPQATHFGVIGAAAGGTLYVTQGEGV
jgi:hypothetical protein